MVKQTIRSFESLRKWVEKRMENTHNIFLLEQASRDIEKAIKDYGKNNSQFIEVEDKP